MGIVEIDDNLRTFLVSSHIITYGNAATIELTEAIREEIETMWNEPKGEIIYRGSRYSVRFRITSSFTPGISPIDVYQNTDARNNYIRIEEFAYGNISFVDGLGCNSGYFKLENLYKGSTTSAHEYGHSLGLDHPKHLDIRGQGVPGIMYPRGTLVDPPYQYDPSIPAGLKGGTMHPMHRRVKQNDIEDLKLQKLDYHHGWALLGEFTNIYHWNHAEVPPGEFSGPVIPG